MPGGGAVRPTLSEFAAAAARLTRDLPLFLRSSVTAEQALSIVKRRLETRSERLLRMVERFVYRHPASAYLRLLQWAGCELGDLRALVAHEGVEGALNRLADHGVYVSFEEFKGRAEVVRGSQRFVVSQEDFDHPSLAPHFHVQTGGTSGPGTRIKIALSYLAEQAPDLALALHAHGLTDADHAVWEGEAVRDILRYARLGRPPLAWFYPLKPLGFKFSALGWYLAAIGFVLGRALPPPRSIDLREPGLLAKWLADRTANARPLCVTTYASSAVRVALAARDRHMRLENVCFVAIGEPFTSAKLRVLEAVGARALVRYGSNDGGTFGYRCAEPRCSDDVHFFSDSYSLIQRPRTLDSFGLSVDAFFFTTLLPSVPKILLNVEIGDHGKLEQRPCDCAMGLVGLREHLSEIRSHEKLTGEGMTFVKTSLLRLLEEILPERFGGSSADYQVLEEEDRDGILRLLLLASPTLGALDERRLEQIFLSELGHGGVEHYMARFRQRAGTVEIRRQAPLTTKAGKVLPFHLTKNHVR